MYFRRVGLGVCALGRRVARADADVRLLLCPLRQLLQEDVLDPQEQDAVGDPSPSCVVLYRRARESRPRRRNH